MKKLLGILVLLLVVGGGGYGYWYYSTYLAKPASEPAAEPAPVAAPEAPAQPETPAGPTELVEVSCRINLAAGWAKVEDAPEKSLVPGNEAVVLRKGTGPTPLLVIGRLGSAALSKVDPETYPDVFVTSLKSRLARLVPAPAVGYAGPIKELPPLLARGQELIAQGSFADLGVTQGSGRFLAGLTAAGEVYVVFSVAATGSEDETAGDAMIASLEGLAPPPPAAGATSAEPAPEAAPSPGEAPAEKAAEPETTPAEPEAETPATPLPEPAPAPSAAPTAPRPAPTAPSAAPAPGAHAPAPSTTPAAPTTAAAGAPAGRAPAHPAPAATPTKPAPSAARPAQPE